MTPLKNSLTFNDNIIYDINLSMIHKWKFDMQFKKKKTTVKMFYSYLNGKVLPVFSRFWHWIEISMDKISPIISTFMFWEYILCCAF